MAKDVRGTKREDPETGKKFYDLNKDPIVSPYTGKSYPRSYFEQAAPKKAERVKPEEEEEEEEEIVKKAVEPDAPEIVSLDEAEAEEESADEVIPDVDGEEEVEDIGEDDADVFLEEDEDDEGEKLFDVGGSDES